MVSAHDRDHDPAVSIIGDVNVANAAMHGDLLCRMVDFSETSTLLVDCSRMACLELRGMAMMVRVDRHAVACGTEVWWIGLTSRHRHQLELAGLDRLLRLCSTGDDTATRR